MTKLKKGDRVCDYQGTQWGTIASVDKYFAFVVWDADTKQKPRRSNLVELRRAGEKHLFLDKPYTDPKA
jgi:preprotein translocase subunit YajC